MSQNPNALCVCCDHPQRFHHNGVCTGMVYPKGGKLAQRCECECSWIDDTVTITISREAAEALSILDPYTPLEVSAACAVALKEER
jgi:hypothetical protein